jgi:hypothetical protein
MGSAICPGQAFKEALIKSVTPQRDLKPPDARRRSPARLVALGQNANAADGVFKPRPLGQKTKQAAGEPGYVLRLLNGSTHIGEVAP